ncbi:hypothetical protein [Paraburkholderia sediminicola]|uniref:hypothetical protein n=2 Tax=Paraburkholderia sediminicola TaxID=458836 RepID=UPI0038BB9D18
MDVKRDASFFARLIAPMLKRLRLIASSTRGEHTVDDLKAEAWIIASDVQTEQGVDLEPDDAELQHTVVTRIEKMFGRFANRKMRFALRLDRDDVDDNGELSTNSIAAGLSGPDVYEPEQAAALFQENEESERRLGARYAEAVAYVRVLEHFDSDKRVIANYLCLPLPTLESRLRRAESLAECQPSMFDGVEIIPADFLPPRGSRRAGLRAVNNKFRSVCKMINPRQAHLFLRLGAVFRKA